MENWRLLVLRSVEDTTCALPTDETDIQGNKPICIHTWTNHYSSKKLLLSAIYSSLTQNLQVFITSPSFFICCIQLRLQYQTFKDQIMLMKQAKCWKNCNWSLPVWFSYFVRCKTYSYSSCCGSCADLKYSAYFCTLQAVIEIWNWKTYLISPSRWLSIAHWHQPSLTV